MGYRSTSEAKNQTLIHHIEITTDSLSSRGGLSVFVRYLRGIGIDPLLHRLFGSMRKNSKGLPVEALFKQLFCFLLDGTSRHVSYFDHLKAEDGYAGTIETPSKDMASSHAIKRFFQAFSPFRIWSFRRLLRRLFLWRLELEQPSLIVLGLDTMVMDNDEALHREGVKPTYKKVKGFQPLQLTYGRFIIDAVFRSGHRHSNYKDTVQKMLTHVIRGIRTQYRQDVPIIIRFDSGFFDQKIFTCLEELNVGYISGGKLYKDIKRYVSEVDPSLLSVYEKRNQLWEWVEFASTCKSWDRFRRTIFCRPQYEDQQRLLEFARPDTVLYTNLGTGEAIDRQIRKAGREELLESASIIEIYHGRGSDELIHRGLKDFADQRLPFRRFTANAAYYYTILVAFFLFETFKEDVTAPVVAVGSYATTVRRKLIDFAAKIVYSSHQFTLKVTAAVYDQTRLPLLWERSADPPPLAA